MTGCETVGNIQIQVIPSYPELPINWAGHRAIATPRELGFTPGGDGCIFPKLPMILSLPSGLSWKPGHQPCRWQLFIRTLSGDVLTVVVEGDSTVHRLKCLLEEIEGTPTSHHEIIFAGRFLRAGDFLRRDCKLQNKSMVIQHRCWLGGGSPWYEWMSFSGGTSIKQGIVQDKVNPRMWDVDSAKTFHLQVVNAAHFEELTGVMAPDTPITIQEYASSGFPFFDIYNETPNSIYGSFGGLKSVAELDSIFQPESSDNWSSEPCALKKCQCGLNLLDCMYVHT